MQFGSPSDVAGNNEYLRPAELSGRRADGAERRRSRAQRVRRRPAQHRRTPRPRDRRQSQRHRLRRADAESPTAPAAPAGDAPAKNTVVYVVADQESVDAATTPPAASESAPDESATPASPRRPDPESAPCSVPPAFVFGAGILPTALLGGILGGLASAKSATPAMRHRCPRYVPPPSMADFVRCRDLTCRFPGCDKPAQVCDLDHTVAYPVGPTHPSNLKCLCRFHHLLKTFWNGATGWRDRQLPDGTVEWTSPTGHTYTTYPGSKHLFPQLCQPTATLWAGEPPVTESTRRPRCDDA